MLDLVGKVELAEPAIGKDAHDALHGTGLKLADAFKPIPWQADEGEPEHALRERFANPKQRIASIFDTQPKPREFLFNDFLPANESGLMVAAGGTGKGYFQIAMTLALVTGEPFGPFTAPKARGVLMVSLEDDFDELHRRMHAALDARYGDGWRSRDDLRAALESRLSIVDLRGLTGVELGTELRGSIVQAAAGMDDCGLILLDPLGRMLKDGWDINSDGGKIVPEIDAIRTEAGSTVLGAHHVNKNATRDPGGELQANAATGHKALTDLSRWVVNLKKLSAKEASDYGLPNGIYVEAAVSKTNYTPDLATPLVFQRKAGGALIHAAATSKTQRVEDVTLRALHSAGAWITRDVWRQRAEDEPEELAKNAVDAARTRLVRDGMVVAVKLREGREQRMVFGPAERSRPGCWPAPPTTIAECDAQQGD